MFDSVMTSISKSFTETFRKYERGEIDMAASKRDNAVLQVVIFMIVLIVLSQKRRMLYRGIVKKTDRYEQHKIHY